MTDFGELGGASIDKPDESPKKGKLKVKVIDDCTGDGIDGVEVIVLKGKNKTKKKSNSSGIADFGEMPAAGYVVKIKKHFDNADYFLILIQYPRFTWKKKAIVEAIAGADVPEGGEELVEIKIKIFRLVAPIKFKRVRIRLSGDKYGHWWTELGGGESYGWWPAQALGLIDTFKGVPGVLNGMVGGTPLFSGGSAITDPHDGDPGDLTFSPVVNDCRTDDELKQEVRSVANGYSGNWSWRFEFGNHCHTFQKKIMGNLNPKGFKDV